MPTDQKLEQYLAILDKNIGLIPTSDRADIVTEIKSHVLSALEKDPTATVSSVLAGLGEPESVANRYLIERGLKPVKPSKSPMIKWLTIGFLGTFGIFVFGVLFLVWKFTPLLEVDEQKGKIKILGGLISVDESQGHFKIGGSTIIHDENSKKFEGNKAVKVGPNGEKILIVFVNGKIETQPSIDDKFHWSCKTTGGIVDESLITTENRVVKFDLSKTTSMKCTVQLPKAPTEIQGVNGKVRLEHPQAAMQVMLDNGGIEIAPHPSVHYTYQAQVMNGVLGDLKSSNAKDAIKIQLQVKNGKISSEN